MTNALLAERLGWSVSRVKYYSVEIRREVIMDEFNEFNSVSETDDSREIIKQKLRQYYDGRIVRKDLTKSIREGANVPVYVLEYLLGQYCNSDDPEIIDEGVENVKRILRDNYVRPDEAQKILSLSRWCYI